MERDTKIIAVAGKGGVGKTSISAAFVRLLTEQYRQQHGWSMEIVGNYCCDVEPSVPIFTMGDRIAARQMGQILELPEDAIKDLPSFFPPRPEGAEQPPSEEQPAAA